MKLLYIIIYLLSFSCVSFSSDLKEEDKMFVVLGYPGAGKGTFAQTLTPYGYLHLSIGDMMRDELKRNSAIGLKYREEIERGKFLPSEVIHQIVENRILEEMRERKKIILDGYPRTLEQAKMLSLLLEKKFQNIDATFFYIKVDPETACTRILNRRTCSTCYKIYNLESCPPQEEHKCDKCSQPLVKRSSDNNEDAKKRIESFHSHLENLITFYKGSPSFIIFDGNKSYSECIQDYQNILK